jgi:hypothetical protein
MSFQSFVLFQSIYNAFNVPALEFKVHLKVCVVYPVIEDNQLEEKFEVKQFFDAANAVLMLVSDICRVILMKHKLLFETADNFPTTHQASVAGNSC